MVHAGEGVAEVADLRFAGKRGTFRFARVHREAARFAARTPVPPVRRARLHRVMTVHALAAGWMACVEGRRVVHIAARKMRGRGEAGGESDWLSVQRCAV